MSYSRQPAEDLAMTVLLHVLQNPDLAERLLAESGLQAEALRGAAGDPEFRVSVLEFLLADDARVVDFSRASGIRPEEVLAARTALAGPGSFGWEAD